MFSVGSDVDLLLILRESPLPFPDRIPAYLPDHAPVDVEVFPYALDEIRQGQSLAQEALSYGRILWQRPGFSPDDLRKTADSTDFTDF